MTREQQMSQIKVDSLKKVPLKESSLSQATGVNLTA